MQYNIKTLINGQGISVQKADSAVAPHYNSAAIVGSVVLVDPVTALPYSATSTNAQVASLNASSAAYTNAMLIKNASGSLLGLTGFNSGSLQFIQLHDSATAPVANAVPVMIMQVAANTNFSYSMARQFAKGIYVVSSSTGPIYTKPTNSDCWFDVQFL